MNTKKFRAKTESIERNNGRVKGIWEVAIDIGYSAVKLISPNTVAKFPSYASRLTAELQFTGPAPAESIMYRDDETGEIWLVGELAQNMIKTGDTSDSEAALYGRDRYYSPMFKVIARTGLGLGMRSNKFGSYDNSMKLVVQTGLPERYMGDEMELVESLAGTHSFSLKIGADDWLSFNFNLDSFDIFVMSQPKGTLFSLCIDKDGHSHPDAAKYLKSSVIIFDPGFGTLDIFPIQTGVVGKGETFSDLGMKRIMQETAGKIRAKYGVEIPVPAMQKYLETGMVPYLNKRTLESKEYPFDELLKDACNEVFDEAIERMMSSINIIDYDYLVVTGGTGAAWRDRVADRLKNLETLKILYGTQNDNLPMVYANVRGYYLYRLNKLVREAKKQMAG